MTVQGVRNADCNRDGLVTSEDNGVLIGYLAGVNHDLDLPDLSEGTAVPEETQTTASETTQPAEETQTTASETAASETTSSETTPATVNQSEKPAALIVGGVLYSLGCIFYVNRRLKFSHAIWHVFVLAGTVVHFFGILFHVVLRPIE